MKSKVILCLIKCSSMKHEQSVLARTHSRIRLNVGRALRAAFRPKKPCRRPLGIPRRHIRARLENVAFRQGVAHVRVFRAAFRPHNRFAVVHDARSLQFACCRFHFDLCMPRRENDAVSSRSRPNQSSLGRNWAEQLMWPSHNRRWTTTVFFGPTSPGVCFPNRRNCVVCGSSGPCFRNASF